MHKPWHTLVFAGFLFGILGIFCLLIPAENTFQFAGFKFSYPTLAQLTEPAKKKNIDEILALPEEEDSTFILTDTASARTVTKTPAIPKKLIQSIQYTNHEALEEFFHALKNIKDYADPIRVLHYGDSQIEGDRITDLLRARLQGMFGGAGPGLISPLPITRSAINIVTTSEGWDRYNVFVSKDNRVSHKNYGVLGGFARFADYKAATSDVKEAELTVTTTTLGGKAVMAYERVKLFYGGGLKKTWCEYYDGPALSAADSLPAGGNFHVHDFEAGNGSYTHRFVFRGLQSPDFYALSLESKKGVMVDNIAMRGSSGTFFHQIDEAQMKLFYKYLNVKLIILQFGGNTIPALKDSVMAANYGEYIRYQLRIIRKLAPFASILFIGPADMSVKVGIDYETYPLLEPTRDAIKKAVLESGSAFFDLYDCMGGKNSMPAWVEAKLAGADYTHFSPKGAKKISQLLTSALIDEYNRYLEKN
jgi:lysophospholipase L1-like esterase